jgi:type II restriction enzyme
MSESWAEKNMYCANCLEPRVTRQIANTPVKDFLCPLCLQPYQLKSQKQPFKALVNDAAYHTFLAAVESGTAPNLILMHYDKSRLRVVDVDIVPRFFLNPSCIIPRKPLSTHARRADWVGCIISLEKLPSDARIEMVRDEKIEEPRKVQEKYRRFVPLFIDKTLKERGWTADVFRCVRQIGKQAFTLREIYAFGKELQKLHPENKNIQPKIRQQLQVLRDHGVLKFAGAGRYELV